MADAAADRIVSQELDALDPATTALLIINPHFEAAHLDPGADAALERIVPVLHAARAAGAAVIYSLLRYDRSNPSATSCGGNDAASPFDDPRSLIIDTLAPLPDEHVLVRRRFSAFFDTELEALLRRLEVETLIIGGYSTNYCAESTTRDASFRDFSVIVLSDGTSPVPITVGDRVLSREETQEFALATLRQWFAKTPTADAVVAALCPTVP